jgi:hypothetical protein
VDVLDPETGRAGLVAAAAIVAAGILYYRVVLRGSAAYGLRGPPEE